MFEEGAGITRRAEQVDEFGPPTDFVDIALLPLKDPEVHTLLLLAFSWEDMVFLSPVCSIDPDYVHRCTCAK